MLGALDILLISAAGLSVVMLAVLAAFYRSCVPGIQEWIIGNVLAIGAFIFFGTGAHFGPLFAFEVPHALYASGAIALATGYRRFLGQKDVTKELMIGLAVLLAVFATFHYIYDLIRVRIVAASIFHASISIIVFRSVRAANLKGPSVYPYLLAQALALALAIGYFARVILQGHAIVIGNASTPLVFEGWALGYLALGVLLFPALTLAGVTLAVDRMLLLAERQAKQDPLTGAWTRRALMETAERDMKRARRDGTGLALVMFDVDKFKIINDTYGHVIGDEVLINFVKHCEAEIREVDKLARVGGDEFMLLLPNTDSAGALETAHRIHKRIISADENVVPYSVSIGVAMFNPDADWIEWVRSADTALYRAKSLEAVMN